MNIDNQDLIFFYLIFSPTIIGLLIGYLFGYDDFVMFPKPIIIMAFAFSALIIFGATFKLNNVVTFNKGKFTLVFYLILGLVIGATIGRYILNYGIFSYVNAYLKTMAIWFSLTIIIDGVVKALIIYKDRGMFDEILFLSVMGILPSYSLLKFKTKVLLKKSSSFTYFGIIALLKFLFSFSTGVTRDQIGPILLWWFDEYSVPIVFSIFITICFALFTAVFKPQITRYINPKNKF